MILSGVGLVAKFKAEKSKKQKDEGKRKKKTGIKHEDTETVCEQCQIEARRAKTHFQFPDRYNSATSQGSSGYGSIDSGHQRQLDSIGELVTIATGEGHCVYINSRYYTVELLQEKKSSSSSHFRKHVLKREVDGNGEVETVVFSLENDPDYYITTNSNKQLELNFFSEEPSSDNPDERFFLVYTTNTNQKIVQPIRFKGYYLHHMDNRLDVTRFDINFRAPEEYFFQFDTVPDLLLIQEHPPPQICTHKQTHKDMISKRDISLKQTVKKEKASSILSDLFMACVSTRSQKSLALQTS